MATWTPDPTFYPSPRLAARAPAEKLAYVVQFDPERRRPDGLAAVDVDPGSSSYGQIVGKTELGGRRRDPSLRLERLQLVPVPERAASRTSSAAI